MTDGSGDSPVHLPPAYGAQRLFDARDAGASDQEMREASPKDLKTSISRTAEDALWDCRM